jgi:hypothetical protein
LATTLAARIDPTDVIKIYVAYDLIHLKYAEIGDYKNGRDKEPAWLSYNMAGVAYYNELNNSFYIPDVFFWKQYFYPDTPRPGITKPASPEPDAPNPDAFKHSYMGFYCPYYISII